MPLTSSARQVYLSKRTRRTSGRRFRVGPQAVIHAPQQRCIWRSQCYRVLSGRYRNFSIAVASFAVPTVDADGYRPVDGHPAHDARLIAIVVDCLVLRRAIVPDRHIAYRPAPAHRVMPIELKTATWATLTPTRCAGLGASRGREILYDNKPIDFTLQEGV